MNLYKFKVYLYYMLAHNEVTLTEFRFKMMPQGLSGLLLS